VASTTSRTLKVKFDGDASGLLAAAAEGETIIKGFGDRIKKHFTRSGEDSGKGFGSSLKKWFKGDGSKLIGEGGQIGGEAFSNGLMGMLKTPVLGPALLAVLAGTAATVLPAVGAIAGAGLVTGFGAGIAGLGIMFAAKSEAVGKVWSKTMTGLGEDMKLLSKPFEATLISIAGFFQRTVDKFNPALAKAFSKMAGPVSTFVDQTARGLEKLVPAIDPITNAFNGVLGALGPAMQSAVGSLATGMTELANSVAKNPQALADMVRGLGGVTKATLDFITTLNDINTKFSTLTSGVSLVTVVFKGIEGIIGGLTGPFELLSRALGGVNALLGKTGKDSADAGTSMLGAASSTTALAAGLGGTATAAQHASPAMRTAAEKIQDAKNAAHAATQKFNDLIASMFRLQNLALGLSGAQVNLQAAIDAASASVKTNGKTLDINTEKGRSNRTALDGIASSANAQTEAMIRANKSNREVATAAEVARTSFVALAVKMGLSKAQAEALARSLIAVPKKTETDFKADITDLDAKIKSAKEKLKDPKLTPTKRAKLEAEIAQLVAAKKEAQRQIDLLHGKTVSLQVNTYKNLIETTVPGGVGVKLPGDHRAAGGPVAAGRTYLVGEKGPEILTMGGSSGHITPNHQLGGPTFLETHIEIGGEVIRVVRSELKQHNRDLKRTVRAGV
jgi:hypothetical protein